jgi:hypothetical protein
LTEVGDSRFTGSSAAFGDLIILTFLISGFFVLYLRVLFIFAEFPNVASGDSFLVFFDFN